MPLVGVALLLTACPSSEPPAERPEDLQAEFVSAMHGRRDAVRGIHDAIVAGDLEGARTAGKELSRANPPGALPEAWLRTSTELEFAVEGIVKAGDLNGAAASVAVTVGTCGSCHRLAGASPSFPPLTHPDRAEGSLEHMSRHRVAAQALWQAIVANSDDHWNQGLRWLAAGPVEQDEFPSGIVLDDEARELEARVHAMAAEGHGVTDPGERVALYGRLISTCAACHAHTKGGPGAAVPADAPSETAVEAPAAPE